MKKISLILFVILAMWPFVYAFGKTSQPNSNAEGTVVRIEKVDTAPAFVGSNPSDAPLAAPETYTYDVVVRVNCATYLGRYENWYDYLPATLSTNKKIDVRLKRGMMYVAVPYQRQLKLQIVARHVLNNQTCNSMTN